MNPLQREQIESKQRSVKKAYNRPQLEIYGELREITKAVSLTPHQFTDNTVTCDITKELCFT